MSPGPTPNAPATGAGPADALAALTAAVRTGDRAAFLGVTRDQDGFDATANLIWSNLTALAPTAFSWTLTGVDGTLPDARRQRLGEAARLHQTRVGWAVVGDSGPAEQLLWATFVPAGSGWRLVALTDRPTDVTASDPVPLWLLEPVTRVAAGAGSVLGADPDAWAAIVSRAAEAVVRRVPARLRAGWNEALVVLLPGNDQLATRVLGTGAGSIAATTFPDGDDADRAPLRVLVHPGEVRLLPTLGRDVLTTHEAVHVATRSPLSRAPLWLIEGYADWVAYDRWPAAAASALDPLWQRVRAGQGPTSLPADDDFTGGDLPLTYAAAWTACGYVARHYGPDRLADLYAAGPAGTAAALRRALGRSAAAFAREWTDDLRRQARE